MERIDFSKYGKSFQEDLAKLILEDRSFSDQIQEVLKLDFLNLDICKSSSRSYLIIERNTGFTQQAN